MLNLFEVIQILFWTITATGVLLAWWSFRKGQKIRRAEWLKSLYEKFYENEQFKTVRRWIDFEVLESELNDDNSHHKEEKLTDFLNFFEFIATLEKMKQLSIVEIHDLFAYYLKRIRQSTACMNYIDQYEFRNLRNLLYKSFTNEKKG